jgi:acetyltransferase-like isoleucine patch superfamily enzyme
MYASQKEILDQAATLIENFDLCAENYNVNHRKKGHITFSKTAGTPLDINLSAQSAGNHVFIGANVTGTLQLNIQGSRNIVYIGDNCKFGTSIINLRNSDTVVCFGNGTTTTGNCRFLVGQNAKSATSHLLIGDDAMMAKDIAIFTSDNHPILDTRTFEIVPSTSKHVVIEPHVWLAEGVKVLKGVTIGCGSVIGAASLVTQDIPRQTIAGGIPAAPLKSNRSWSRHDSPESKQMAKDICTRFASQNI